MDNRIDTKSEQILEVVTKRKREGETILIPSISEDSVNTVANQDSPYGGHTVKKETAGVKEVERYMEKLHQRAKNSGIKNAEAALINDLWTSFVQNGWIIPSKMSTPYVPSASGVLIPAGKDILVKSLFNQELELPNSDVVKVNKLSLAGSKNMQFDPDYMVGGLPYLFQFSRKNTAPKGKIKAEGYATMEFRKVSQITFDKFFNSQLEQIMDGPYSMADKLGKKVQLKNVQGILENLNRTFITSPTEYCFSLGVLFSTLADLYDIGFKINSPQIPKDITKITVCVSDPSAIISTKYNQPANHSQIEIAAPEGKGISKENILIQKNYKK